MAGRVAPSSISTQNIRGIDRDEVVVAIQDYCAEPELGTTESQSSQDHRRSLKRRLDLGEFLPQLGGRLDRLLDGPLVCGR
jgi:hypothetical protein